MRVLRPYQTAALEATRRQLQQYESTVVVLPTGLGKTVYAAKLIADWETGNTLFLAHTRELIEQAADKLGAELGYRPAVEMNVQSADPETLWQGGLSVVGSVQTMYGDRRLAKYDRHPFGLIVVDECFPAGTTVDGRPIETIRPGEFVTAFDELTGETAQRRVVRTFSNPAPRTLFSIAAAGRTVTATSNHPFLTTRGWVNAGDIQVGDRVFGLFADVRGPSGAAADEVQARGRDAVLLPALLHDLEDQTGPGDVPPVPVAVPGGEESTPLEGQRRQASVLLGGMHEGALCGRVGAVDGGDEPQVRVRPDEGEQPDEARGRSTPSLGFHAGDRSQAANPGRERPRPDGAGTPVGGGDRSVPARRSDRRAGARLPDELQTRPGEPPGQALDRDRRREPQEFGGPGGGRTQDVLLGVARVDRVEVHERGGVGGRDAVCPDGRVYNLEVDGEHTYLANGFAAHNCHHATAATYRKVIDHFRTVNPNLKVVGITATPNRSDGTALGLMFESVAYQMSINDAVGDGWLVPVAQEYVVVDSLSFDGIKTRKNEFGESDFSAMQLEELLTQEEALHKMAVPTVEKVGDRPALVFTATVRHAHELAAVLNRYRQDSAAAVDGTTPKEERKRLVQAFANKELQFLCNCAVLTEGFDAPNCAAIVMGRPTKSLGLYTQMLGRGLRPLPGTVDGVSDKDDRRLNILASDKPSCLVLDFVGNSEHRLANAYDVLGGNYDSATRELARREAARERKDIGEVLEQANLLLGLERQWKEREHITARNASYSSHQVNPFEDGPSFAGAGDLGPERGTITDSQLRLLVNLGVRQDTAMRYSKRQAGAVIDEIAAKRCTEKQAGVLRKNGIDPTGIGMDRASRIIDAIAANGWRRPEVLPE